MFIKIICKFCKSPEVTLCGWWGYKPWINIDNWNYQGQHWGNSWEMGWSAYGPSRAHRYHLELNWTELGLVHLSIMMCFLACCDCGVVDSTSRNYNVMSCYGLWLIVMSRILFYTEFFIFYIRKLLGTGKKKLWIGLVNQWFSKCTVLQKGDISDPFQTWWRSVVYLWSRSTYCDGKGLSETLTFE